MDSAEHQRAEERLSESEERFRTLANNISQLAWMADETGWVFWYNQRWYDYTGTSWEEMQGWGWQKVHHPDHVNRVVENISRCFETGETWEDTFPLRGKEGQYRWFLSRAIPIRDEHGRVVRWIGTNTDVTQQREAEEALRRSEQRYRSFVEASAQVVWRTGPTGAVDEPVPAWNAYTGQSEQEAAGLGWMNAIHPDDRPRVSEARRRASEARAVYEVEYHLRRHDGAWRNVLARGVPIFEPDGHVREYIGICSDITERKQAQAALRQSEEKFRAVFEQAAIGMGRVRFADARWIDVNDAFCQMLGYSREEMLATPWPQITHPEDVELNLVLFQRMAAGELDDYTLEKRFIHKKGHHVWARLTLSLVRDAQGRPDYEIAIIEDITERKQSEQAQAMLAAVVESSPDAIIGESLDGTILGWNTGARRLFGYTAKEAVGRPISILFPEEQSTLVGDHLEQLYAGKTIRRQEVERVRKDGSRIFISLSISPIRDSTGRVIAITKIAHDITDLKHAHEELRAARDSAEQAKAAAEQANREKDHFLAILSHELRTPLTPVLATVTMMQEEYQWDEDMDENLKLIRRNVEVQTRLIDDLLDLTRFARGKLQLDKHPVSLCTVLQRAAEVCMSDIEARQLHFGVDLPDGPYLVEADPARLQQVFWNLLKNAIKFTPVGGCVGVRCRREGPSHAVVEVSDSGIGIEPDMLTRVFDAFEQGEVNQTRQFGGLGLGLAISKAMVDMHGGTIEALSLGKDQGATFRVRLPLLQHAAISTVSSNPGPAAEGRRSSVPLRVLLVEDHRDTSAIMARLLRSRGHFVETAANVATALRKAEEQEFDILVSDLGLPDGSGQDLMKALRARGSTLPGIALSGYGQEHDVQRSLEAGFATHLTKPIIPDQLVEVILRVARKDNNG